MKHWVEILTVFLLLVGLSGILAVESSHREEIERRGVLRLDHPKAGALELPQVDDQRQPLSAQEEELLSNFEAGWISLAQRPSSRIKRESLMTVEVLALQSGRFVGHAERLESLYRAGRIMRTLARLYPAVGPIREQYRNLADLLPFVARARWHLGAEDGARMVAEQAVLELPDNADAFMILGLIRAQTGVETRTEALGLRNLLARVVAIDPGFVDPSFQLRAESIRQAVADLERETLQGFDVDTIPPTRNAVRKALDTSLEQVEPLRNLVSMIERWRARFR